MRGALRAAAVCACAAAAACGGSQAERRALPPEPGVRIWAPPVVRWEAGAPRRVDFAVENTTSRTVTVAAPDPRAARVDVLSGPESLRVCGAAPAERLDAGAPVTLAPGDRMTVRVELDGACARVAPGAYRYEVSYRVAALPGGEGFSGTLPVQFGQVLVAAPGAAGR